MTAGGSHPEGPRSRGGRAVSTVPFRQDTPGAHPDPRCLEAAGRLRNAGETDAARALLERFVEAHPSHPLPDDLRPLQPASPPAP